MVDNDDHHLTTTLMNDIVIKLDSTIECNKLCDQINKLISKFGDISNCVLSIGIRNISCTTTIDNHKTIPYYPNQ